jgi:hypothetical protein
MRQTSRSKCTHAFLTSLLSTAVPTGFDSFVRGYYTRYDIRLHTSEKRPTVRSEPNIRSKRRSWIPAEIQICLD